jgi:hypothetical protein
MAAGMFVSRVVGLIVVAASLAFEPDSSGESHPVNDRIESILRQPGGLQDNDVAFLMKNSKRLIVFAKRFMEAAGLGGENDALEAAALPKLMRMLEAADSPFARAFEKDIVERLVRIAAEARVDTSRSLCESLLRSDNYSLRAIGMKVLAARYPDPLIKALGSGEIEDQMEAIRHLAMSGAKGAVPVLRKIAEETSDAMLRGMARLAIAKIEGERPPDHFEKSTPQRFAQSFVALVKQNPEEYVKEDMEFWGNPMFDPYREQWESYLKSPDTDKKRAELADRRQAAKWLEEALEEPGKSFVVTGRQCIVSIRGEEVMRLHKDMFGQWRIIPMP